MWGSSGLYISKTEKSAYSWAFGWEEQFGGHRWSALRALGWKMRSDAHHELAFSLPVLFMLLALPTRALWRTRRSGWQDGHCHNCGYDLTGNVSGRCPECGELPSPETGRRLPRKAIAEWFVYAAMWVAFLSWAFLWKFEPRPSEMDGFQ